ncbi:MAG: ABC transporter ATP-binding protein [Proteobacteria bacterium]|nr:ABC transporter ATP-binding protein [Pseudomonadota bacterium]
MTPFTVRAQNIGKTFNRKVIFQDVSFELGRGASLAITGRNGSGKSTLVKIVAGVLSPTKGTLLIENEGHPMEESRRKEHLGLVSPYLQLYDEFTASENIEILSRIRGIKRPDPERVQSLLSLFALWERRDDELRVFSSGMKQRLKYVFALVHMPTLLILDEPTANLDAEGVSAVKQVVREQKGEGIVIVATNEADEAKWCDNALHLGQD